MVIVMPKDLTKYGMNQEQRNCKKNDSKVFQYLIPGLLLDQDIALNRRSDSGRKIFRLDINNIDEDEVSRNGVEPQDYEGLKKSSSKRKISSGLYHEDRETLRPEDEITRIKGCATMWHENTEEIIVMLKSIFRMDEDFCARYNSNSLSQ